MAERREMFLKKKELSKDWPAIQENQEEVFTPFNLVALTDWTDLPRPVSGENRAC